MDYVTNLKPDLIINCAAYTAVDKAEENFELTDKINGDGPTFLAKAAKANGCKLVHISTSKRGVLRGLHFQKANYNPNVEGGLKWDDPEIAIKWPMGD